MGEKFSRRDFLKGMAVVTASGWCRESDPGTGWLLQNDYSQNICRCSDVHCRAGPCFFQNVEAGGKRKGLVLRHCAHQ